jgi:hypothetical protein
MAQRRRQLLRDAGDGAAHRGQLVALEQLDLRTREALGGQLQRQLGAHAGLDDDIDEGLGDVVDRAMREALGLVGGTALHGHEDDGHAARARVGLELVADLIAAHPRHQHVEQDQVGQLLGTKGQRLGAAGGHGHLAFVHQQLVERMDVVRLVVDNEDERHGGPG